MLTIEEKIRQLEAIAESGDELYADYEEHGLQDTRGARRIKSLIEEKRQKIAWLRELHDRRKADSCEGCKNIGLWENEYEYGVSCPCLRCARRAKDNYEPERRTE